MTIIKYKPTSPGMRHLTRINNKLILNKVKPCKKLVIGINKTGGRNNLGRITTRHIGGGHKKKYRIIDFKRNKFDIFAKVFSIEYDPNRSSNICLLIYKDGEKRYIIHPKKLKVGDIICSIKNNIEYKNFYPGNSFIIKDIPIGSILHNIEIYPGKGGVISRSAGSYAQLMSKEDNFTDKKKCYSILKLKSGEIRKISIFCRATIGEVGNSEHSLISFGKAGSSRWRGIRPTVRGTAMNPIDHPHGGGEGKNFGKHPVTPWGKKTKGKKTRNNFLTEKFIIKHCNFK